MSALAVLAIVLAGDPRAPSITSSANFPRAPKMVVLFRRWDAFFPASCVSGGKLRSGDACLSLMPRTPTVRLMDGRDVQLEALAKHPISAWDAPQRRGWAAPVPDAGEAPETELAVWPANANPGLEPAPDTPTSLDLEGLRALPDAEPLPVATSGPRPSWPPAIRQTVLDPIGAVVVLSGVRRGLYLRSPGGKWRALRPEGDAEVATTIVGRADLDGDGKKEWLVHVAGWNEFAFEVWSHDFAKPLFVFNDCGV